MTARNPSAIRLLMTADAVGGVWTYGLELAAALGPHAEVTLAVLGPSPSAGQARAARAIPGLQLVETGLPLDWAAGSPAEVREAGQAVAQLARESGAEIVHLNSPALAAGAGFAAPVVGACHSCLATWWSAVCGGDMPENFSWRTRLLAEGYAACDALVAPTRAFADATAQTYGLRPRTVWNGRTPPAPPLPVGRDALALTAGRLWDKGKGAAILDAAAALALVRIEAIGPTQDPSTHEEVELRAVRRLGPLDAEAVRERLQRSRVFVSPALYEPFGLAVLEAAQAGCALVLSDIPTFRELWDGAALFVPAGDPAALARALERLVPDREACEALGAKALRRAAAYRPEPMADGMAAIYRSFARRGALREAVA